MDTRDRVLAAALDHPELSGIATDDAWMLVDVSESELPEDEDVVTWTFQAQRAGKDFGDGDAVHGRLRATGEIVIDTIGP